MACLRSSLESAPVSEYRGSHGVSGGCFIYLLSSFYLIALAAPPIMLGLVWWGWFRDPRLRCSRWRTSLFFSGLCAGTLNVTAWWGWVVWLRFHYTTDSWKVRDVVSDCALWLLFFSIVTAIAGKGRYRLLLAISGVLAALPWIPIGIL